MENFYNNEKTIMLEKRLVDILLGVGISANLSGYT